MRHTTLFIAALIVAAGVLAAAQRNEPRAADTPDVVLKAAINQELVDGNLTAAVQRYRDIVTRFRTAAPAVAAQALVRMGASYDKLGSPEARKAYEEILRDFRSQRDAAATALARLGGAPKLAIPAPVTVRSVMRGSIFGTVSPDGLYLTFEDATGNLSLRDLRSGTDRPLTKRVDFNLGLSAISKDSRFAAFSAWDGGCQGAYPGLPALCLVPVEGNTVPIAKLLVASEDIKEIQPMDWSPDGRSIAVSLRRADRSAQIALVFVADGAIRVLRSVDWRGPSRMFFSPDGLDLAFDLPATDSSDQRDVFVMAVDGSRGLTAVEHASQDIAMGWTPDGAELLFASDRGGAMGLWGQGLQARRPSGAPRLLRSNLGGAWSLGITTGGALYFGVRSSERDVSIATIDIASGKLIASPTRPIERYVGTNMTPDWSPDGKSLAYVSQRGFNPTNNTGMIIGIRTDSTGEVRELQPRLLYFLQISWAPDSRSLLTSGIDVKGRSGVFRIDATTGDVTLIAETIGNAYPKWSPDGTHVYYRKNCPVSDSERCTLADRDLRTGSERTVTSGALGNFSVSPDGQSIAVLKGGPIGLAAAQAVVQVRIDTGATRDLLRAGPSEILPPWASLPWTPDGKAVLVRKRTPNELWVVPMTGAAPYKFEADVRTWAFNPFSPLSLHPDGRRVAFVSGNVSSEVMVLDNFLSAR